MRGRPVRARLTGSRCRLRPARPRWSMEIRPAASALAARPSPGRRRRGRQGVLSPARRPTARTRRGPRRPGRWGRRSLPHPSPPAPTAPRRPDGECAGPAAAGPHREPAILFPLCRCGKMTVAGIGLTLLLGACTTSEPTAVPTRAAGSEVLATPAAQMSNGPAPDEETFSIGPAATDTIGGYHSRRSNRHTVRYDEPGDRVAGSAVAGGDPECSAQRGAGRYRLGDHVGMADQGVPATAVR